LVGYRAVFLATAGLIALSGCLTFRLEEPRHRGRRSAGVVGGGQLPPIGTGGEE
jgi:hypothetical protein